MSAKCQKRTPHAGAVKLPGLLFGGAPFWGPIFGGLSQSTPHTIGIEVHVPAR
jgi:hypothetical protein